jgi:hypothetical protein
MSERLPYEEQLPQHLRDIPLPDEDAAWADMKRRLEEDDDDGVIAWWKKGCLGWGLLLLALIGIGIGFFIKYNSDDQHTETGTASTKQVNAPRKQEHPADTLQDDHQHSIPVTATPAQPSITVDSTMLRKMIHRDTIYSPEIITQQTIKDPKEIKTKRPAKIPITQKKDPAPKPVLKPVVRDTARDIAVRKDTVTGIADTTIKQPVTDTISIPDSMTIDKVRRFIAGDTSAVVKNDSLKKATDEVIVDSTGKKKTDSSAQYSISGGLALTQQLPIAGQKAVPYGSQGRGFSMADYIPSVYVRFNKNNKWFIQGEFRYGAPQYNKPLTYFQQGDTIGGGASRLTEKQLQKTYYHQLPISFNFYIRPEWAVGAGFVWNRFAKSVFQQTVSDPLVPDSFISKDILVGRNAAAEGLASSYFQGLIESQYQWKKFSFGARYTFGLKPYLTFTLPGEAERRERNQSLQLFIRYQLFRKNLER